MENNKNPAESSSECLSNEFKCECGSCINGQKLCDGIADCATGEDESLEECAPGLQVFFQ